MSIIDTKRDCVAEVEELIGTYGGADVRLAVLALTDPVETLEGPGQVGHAHPATSRRAASHVVGFGTQRHRVLDLLSQERDALAAELAPHLGMSRNQTATRLGELRDAGLVEWARDSEGRVIERRTNPHDPTSTDTGQAQRITTAGIAALVTIKRKDTP